jgi:protease-4
MRRKKRWFFVLILGVMIIVGIIVIQLPPRIAPGSYLIVPISGSYSDAPGLDFTRALVGTDEKSLTDLLLQLHKATVDDRIRGVVLQITGLDLPLAKVQELRAAIHDLRQAGKEAIAWVTGEATSGNGEYYLASAASQLYFAENTLLPLLGLRASYLFLGGLWDKLDIDMQVEQVKEYKTFGDFLARQTMSEAHRDMANALLDNLSEQLRRDIAAVRQLTPEQVQRLIDTPTLTAADYQQAGLIDGIRYFDDLLDDLKDADGTDAPKVSLDTYRQVKPTSLGLRRGPKIAVVFGIGGITPGESGWSAIGTTMGADTITKAIKKAAEDEAIQAIIFRVDSPGGSALASDLIWHAVVQAKRVKPVIVSMSATAASGGYYISAGATRIVAQPATLTGSIGIVVSHANIEGLMAKFGINMETLSRGRYAQLFSPASSWSAAERQQIQRVTGALYDTFIRKVAAGRNLNVQQVDDIGRGRVWTGEQAKNLGLVDELGGMATALRLAKEAVGIAAEQAVELVFYPKPKGLLALLLQRLGLQTNLTAQLPEPLREVVHRFASLAASGPGPLLAMPGVLQIR